MNENQVIKNDKCPACGSKERFFEELGKLAIKKGVATDNFKFAYDSRNGVAGDPGMLQIAPTGTEMPAYSMITDVCKKCGCIYATHMEVRLSKKLPPPPKILVPNYKPQNNPLTS